MSFLSRIFGKWGKVERPLDSTEPNQLSVNHRPSAYELAYEDAAVGLRHKESGKAYWLPWCLFQNVEVVMREPFIQGQYAYDIMAEFQNMDIEWEVNGFKDFLGAMCKNLENFNIEMAQNSIDQLSRERPVATIYMSPSYPEDIATRASSLGA